MYSFDWPISKINDAAAGRLIRFVVDLLAVYYGKHSSGFLRTAQLSRSASSIAPYIENGSGKDIETGIACAFLEPGLDHGVAAAAQT